jgi:hypothetical protein
LDSLTPQALVLKALLPDADLQLSTTMPPVDIE